MKEVLLHNQTRKHIQAFIKQPSHALLVTGVKGSGKFLVAKLIAAELLGLDSAEKLNNYPYYTHIKKLEDKQDISIEQIRNLIKQLRLKTPGKQLIRRVIVIEDAQYLNDEAANAMLKILEEPSAETVFILTTDSAYSLLPTVASRAQQLTINAISLSEIYDYAENQFKEAAIDEAWQLSQGRAGLLLALLNEDKTHPLKEAIESAKLFLRKAPYERLLMVDELGRDKHKLSIFLEAMGRLLAALYVSAASKGSPSQAKKLLASRKLVQELSQALDANVATRLLLLQLSVNLI